MGVRVRVTLSRPVWMAKREQRNPEIIKVRVRVRVTRPRPVWTARAGQLTVIM